MDPISLAVTVLAIYGILSRAPGLAGEAVREWGYARRGAQSPAALERRERLTEAGIDPAAGGAARQFFGNAWRDFWLDADAKRQADRQARLAGDVDDDARSWSERFADRLDDEVARRAARWRTRPEGQREPYDGDDPTFGPAPTAPNAGGPSDSPQPPNPGGDGEFESTVIHDSHEYEVPSFTLPNFGPTPPPRDSNAGKPGGAKPTPPQDQGPIRVDATVGDPIRPQRSAPSATAVLTAGGTMSVVATTQHAVTGVVSGAAEARAIQRQIDNATAEYVAQLARIRGRIHALGESTLGIVQMSARSRVIALTATAAESAAAAQANAKACGGEVGPLLGQVAREFNRISS